MERRPVEGVERGKEGRRGARTSPAAHVRPIGSPASYHKPMHSNPSNPSNPEAKGAIALAGAHPPFPQTRLALSTCITASLSLLVSTHLISSVVYPRSKDAPTHTAHARTCIRPGQFIFGLWPLRPLGLQMPAWPRPCVGRTISTKYHCLGRVHHLSQPHPEIASMPKQTHVSECPAYWRAADDKLTATPCRWSFDSLVTSKSMP